MNRRSNEKALETQADAPYNRNIKNYIGERAYWFFFNEGIRLIELANYVAAPIVGRIAADLGAEVIKIEGRGGDAWRATSMGPLRPARRNPLFDIYQRERTGKGDFVTMSLYNAGMWMSGGRIVKAEDPYNHEYPEKRNFGMPTNLLYRCSDGEWIRCTIFEYDRYADKFFAAIGVTGEMADLGCSEAQIEEIIANGALS